eukprot:scaffold76961_cov18-Phaeocystis_antarctica.AAC.1
MHLPLGALIDGGAATLLAYCVPLAAAALRVDGDTWLGLGVGSGLGAPCRWQHLGGLGRLGRLGRLRLGRLGRLGAAGRHRAPA